jgi:hypothetical protein
MKLRTHSLRHVRRAQDSRSAALRSESETAGCGRRVSISPRGIAGKLAIRHVQAGRDALGAPRSPGTPRTPRTVIPGGPGGYALDSGSPNMYYAGMVEEGVTPELHIMIGTGSGGRSSVTRSIAGGFFMFRLALPLFACLCVVTTPLSASTLGATATYTSASLGGGEFQYDLTLNNTGTTTIGTFWFAWIPGMGFLSAPPTSVTSPSGWTESQLPPGMAIQWVTTTPLAAGGSLSGFQFDSTETPTELMGTASNGDPVTTSFVYINAPFGDPGFQFVATPAAAPVPEPSTFALSTILAIAFAVRTILKRKEKIGVVPWAETSS